jgi:putative transcriptional regulator
MIRCHLSTLMGKAKMNIADVNRETGLNRTTISALYHETPQRVELQAVEKLCALFNCGVGELFEYCPNEPTTPSPE